jgi:uncharacterized membrane protein
MIRLRTCPRIRVPARLEAPLDVGKVDRVVSGALGLKLLDAGFRQRGVVRGLALMGAGALLLKRGVTGRTPLYRRAVELAP